MNGRRPGPGYRLIAWPGGKWIATVWSGRPGGVPVEVWAGTREDARREAEAELERMTRPEARA